jgi:hypothetical protein
VAVGTEEGVETLRCVQHVVVGAAGPLIVLVIFARRAELREFAVEFVIGLSRTRRRGAVEPSITYLISWPAVTTVSSETQCSFICREPSSRELSIPSFWLRGRMQHGFPNCLISCPGVPSDATAAQLANDLAVKERLIFGPEAPQQ